MRGASVYYLGKEAWLRGLIGWRDILPNLWPETAALTQQHLAKGHEVWLITATPQLVAQVIAARLRLTGALGTRVEAKDGVLTGELDGHVLHGGEKASQAAGQDRANARSVNLLLLVATLVARLTKQLAVLLLGHTLATLFDD
ncbi:Phosphoserine phosphatase [Leifsonia rubra CMS 76R]|nr:Phosphoserine phosphatase [Leifsonia rubra CMS 76R]